MASTPDSFIPDAEERRHICRLWVQNAAVYLWDRRFFVSPRRGIMELVPYTVEQDHMLCLPLGCSRTVVLRPFGNGECYRLLGDAYVDGLMYGEAMDLLRNGALEVEEFLVH
jgi:hypothetical protein